MCSIFGMVSVPAGRRRWGSESGGSRRPPAPSPWAPEGAIPVAVVAAYAIRPESRAPAPATALPATMAPPSSVRRPNFGVSTTEANRIPIRSLRAGSPPAAHRQG